MRRQRDAEELDERPARLRSRPVRARDEEAWEEEPEAERAAASPLPDALLALAGRFGLEAWAGEHDDRGLWAFALVLDDWLGLARTHEQQPASARVEAIRLLTNLFIILGAVIRPLAEPPADAYGQTMDAVIAARRSLSLRHGMISSFPGAGRAMERLIRVRGWRRLSAAQQSLAEALLGLYLEVLAAIVNEPVSESILAASEAWLTVVRLQALPPGFDERLLRAISWYLETYTLTCPRA